MEVDLVVCFDANVSPLRMIQRMGRTGRKHEGRVDIHLLVLYLEGLIFFSLIIECLSHSIDNIKSKKCYFGSVTLSEIFLIGFTSFSM